MTARRIAAAGLAVLVSLGLLAGCSNTDGGASASSSSTKSDSNSKVTTIEIASGVASKPYTWKNDKGELEGYDIDVAKAIDEKLPEIKLHWNSTDFQSLFLGVDAGQYQVVANDVFKNAEREQKYQFSDQSYLNVTYAIAYNPERFDGKVSSLKDLAGKTVSTFSDGSAVQNLLEAFNKDNPDEASNLVHGDYSAGDLLLTVENGQADATVVNGPTAQVYAKEHGTDLKVVDLPADEQGGQGNKAYFLFGKDEKSTEAKKAFDKGLKEIIDDGTLSKISIEHFGVDYTKN
ncbi:transporter substrate-binding domain-containing protein [Bifidobacterium olomucense]|uniref:Glutamine ABC transporter substrate-binding protein n=1 Tax=Bifidobacterium olomucense TaxID=2675324 RepID=A0A7Y0HWT8_9BIFI|nr:transporter substrate-binding domain-containing protein [Bifidobacterium sp. DSM 109959]NMM98656.1 glutamine ABC transporter substrate-binding protein [Bifidobacterium sp. DSM 109959]